MHGLLRGLRRFVDLIEATRCAIGGRTGAHRGSGFFLDSSCSPKEWDNGVSRTKWCLIPRLFCSNVEERYQVSTGEKKSGPQMKSTLGLTGLTMNAMALIAPGAFLWLTFGQQIDLWSADGGLRHVVRNRCGVVAVLCDRHLLRGISKLYPGAGSSYFFAEQAFLSKTHAYKFARLSKYIIGWASHLYYWIYPGVMVGVTAILVGYMAGQFWPKTFNPGVPSPTLMIGFCVIFAFGVAYIAYRGVVGATGVNIAINIVQISASVDFLRPRGRLSGKPSGRVGRLDA